MKKYLFSFLLSNFLVNFVFSQTINLGEPYLLKSKIQLTQSFYRTPTVDNVEALKSSLNEKTKVRYFGKEFNVSINVLAASEKTILPNGNVLFQYGIECKNAVSINLQFDQFHLPEGAILYIVDPVHGKFDGAYTHFNNNKANMLGTEILKTDKIIIEVLIPAEKQHLAKLNLNMIVHGYKSLDSILKSLNSSGTCEIDVNCPLGLGWENQRNSVALVIMGGGTCTGSLVNNTSGTIIPYLLSANHCGTTPGAWVYRFRWESPENQVDCGTVNNSVDGPKTMSVNGGVLCAANSDSDFTLTLLNQAPDPSWDIYYNGWNRTDIPATQLTVIHHPAGDIKKISRDNSMAVSSSFNGGVANSHWRAPSWDEGVTEGGSSGSPLFDQNHRIIGQLHGGNSSCGAAPADMNDDFGKFFMSWTGGNTNSTRLSNWLDPNNIAPDFIDGVNPAVPNLVVDGGLGNLLIEKGTLCGGLLTPKVTLYNNGIDTIFSVKIKYGFDGQTNLEYLWNDTLTTYKSIQLTLPSISLVGGNHSIKAIFSNELGTDLNAKNDTVTKTFSTIDNGRILKLNMEIFCSSDENSYAVIDQNQNVAYSSGALPKVIPLILKDSFCVAEGCYTFKLYDSYGDGIAAYGNKCAGGFYTLTDTNNIILSQMTPDSAAFGFEYSSNFCANISNNSEPNQLMFFPNPTHTSFQVVSYSQVLKSIEITTMAGQKMYYSDELQSYNTINVKSLAKGVYLVKIATENGIIVKQLVVD